MVIQSFSGIRGIYPKDLNRDRVQRYMVSLREFLKQKIKSPVVVVAQDTREANADLHRAVQEVFPTVIDLGVVPIAVAQHAVREYGADAGIVITASHNPPEYTGYKFLEKRGSVFKPEDMESVLAQLSYMDMLAASDCDLTDKRNDAIEKYTEFVKSTVGTFENKVPCLLDANGGAALILPRILEPLGLSNIEVINKNKGEFKREIEPTKDSLSYLLPQLQESGAEFAAGFDCDADRVEIIMKDGTMVDGNQILAIITDHILAENPGKVITNDATSLVIRDICKKHNCELVEVEVGEINVVHKMRMSKSPVGGEGSNGGVIISPSTCRDGILTIIYLLKIMNTTGKSLTDLITGLPKYYSARAKVSLREFFDKDDIAEKYELKGHTYSETGDFSGGLKIHTSENSFVWFRESKTEEKILRIITDAPTQEESNKLLAEAMEMISYLNKDHKF